jgi:hypothetical protein
MIKRKLLALGLAAVMTLSTSVVAFADDISGTNLSVRTDGIATKSINTDAEVSLPTITVLVPTDNEFILNPYRLTATAATAATDGSASAVTATVNSGVISPVYNIQSASDVALKVSVSISEVKPTDGVTLSTTKLGTNLTTKTAFVYIDFKKAGQGWGYISTDDAGTVTYADGTTGAKSVYSAQAKTQAVLHNTETYIKKQGNVDVPIVLNDAITIDAGTAANPATVNYSYFGEANSTPSTPWTASDAINCKLRFTFTPVANTVTTTKTAADVAVSP